MQVGGHRGHGRARLPAPRARQQRRQAHRRRQGALLVHAQRVGRRHRRPHRLLLPRRLLPPGGERGHRREGHPLAGAPAPRACDAGRARSRRSATARCSRSRGRARARSSGRRFPARAPRRETLAPFNAALAERDDGRAHRLHRRGRLRGRLPADRAEAVVEAARRRRRAARGPGRARHAAPRSRHEPLRPGHGRGRLAARRRPRLDRGPQGAARFRRPRGARDAGPVARVPGPAPRWTRAACCARTSACVADNGEGEITSGTFSPTLAQVDRARAPAAAA